jgi:hypothetical protein
MVTRSTTATWHDIAIGVLLAAGAVASQPLLGVPASAAASSNVIVVQLDQAKLITLPKGERTIVVDNPRIARVTDLPDSNRAVVTGLAFGETRVTVLINHGEAVTESTIKVTEPSGIGVTVYRGGERSTYYDCARLCQPRMQLGDTSKQFVTISEQIRVRNDRAMGGSAQTAPPSKKPPAESDRRPRKGQREMRRDRE